MRSHRLLRRDNNKSVCYKLLTDLLQVANCMQAWCKLFQIKYQVAASLMFTDLIQFHEVNFRKENFYIEPDKISEEVFSMQVYEQAVGKFASKF